MGSLGWFNVKDYGAVGDGSADDLAALNAAIAAFNAAGRGVLYLPAPSVAYAVHEGLDAITANGIVLGDGSGSEAGGYGTLITCDSATAVLLLPQAGYTRFQGLRITNNAAGTVTAGAGIRAGSIDPAQRTLYDDVMIDNFFDGIDSQGGAYWTARDVVIRDSWRYGIRIRNVAVPDQGDWLLDHLSILSGGGHNTDAAVRIESSGAGRIQNLEVLGAIGAQDYGIDVVGDGATSILQVQGCSIESYGISGVRSVGSWPYQNYSNMEFGQYGNASGHAFDLQSGSDINIDLINLASDSSPALAIARSGMARVNIGSNITNNGFDAIS